MFSSVSAHAEVIHGLVSEEGEPVAKAKIVVVNADNRVIVNRGYSDADGTFRFTLEPGLFDVGVFKADYVDAWSKGIELRGEDLSISIELVNKAFADGGPLPPDDDGCD